MDPYGSGGTGLERTMPDYGPQNPAQNDLMQRLFSTPGALEQLMSLGQIGDQRHILQQQLAQAQALRQPSGAQYRTGPGAALGGLGDLIRNIVGGLRENKLRSQEQDLLEKQRKARETFAGLFAPRDPMTQMPDPMTTAQMNAPPHDDGSMGY